MRRWLVLALLGVLACNDTSGEVLTTRDGDGDGGTGGPDADTIMPDADPNKPDANPECMVQGPCPEPSLLTVSVCGWAVDVETSETIKAPTDVTIQFFNLGAIDGPSLGEAKPDECGWFAAEVGGLIPGLLVMSTDDDELSGTNYSRVVTLLTSSLQEKKIANAPVLRSSVDQAWGDAAGLGGSSFSDVGALLLMFFDTNQPALFPYKAAPVAGVTITENGAAQSSDDYYFSDTNPLLRTTVEPGLVSTGADGVGLIVNTNPLDEYSGSRLNCGFPDTNGVIPGIIQAQEIYGPCN